MKYTLTIYFTCIAKAFRATEMGPFSANQAAISERKQSERNTVQHIRFGFLTYITVKFRNNYNHNVAFFPIFYGQGTPLFTYFRHGQVLPLLLKNKQTYNK